MGEISFNQRRLCLKHRKGYIGLHRLYKGEDHWRIGFRREFDGWCFGLHVFGLRLCIIGPFPKREALRG